MGTYMLSFDIGAYFLRTGIRTSAPPFLGIVPIRFAIAEPDGHLMCRCSFLRGVIRLTGGADAMTGAQMQSQYPRDLVGYGATPPHPRWPGDARIAVQFVVNFEEGGENCMLHGDDASEAFLSEIVGAQPWPGQRHLNMESVYEYGARAGFWRLWRTFQARNLPVTVYAVAHALMRNPEAVAAMKQADWEIATHGLKWIEYKDFNKTDERAHIHEAIRYTPN